MLPVHWGYPSQGSSTRKALTGPSVAPGRGHIELGEGAVPFLFQNRKKPAGHRRLGPHTRPCHQIVEFDRRAEAAHDKPMARKVERGEWADDRHTGAVGDEIADGRRILGFDMQLRFDTGFGEDLVDLPPGDVILDEPDERKT